MSLTEIKRGKELASKGKNHLAYLNEMPKKDYELAFSLPDIPPPTPKEIKEAEDRALHKAMIDDLEDHKLRCSGCTEEFAGKVKSFVRRLS